MPMVVLTARIVAASARSAIAWRAPLLAGGKTRAAPMRQATAYRAPDVMLARLRAAAITSARFGRVAGDSMRVLGMASAGAGGGSGGGSGPGVVLPEAWRTLALPAGYICPLLGQLALLRGEVAEYDAAAGCLRIGGRVLIGTAGKVFAFGSKASADMWAVVNAAKGTKEAALLADLPAASLASLKAKKGAAMAARAAAVTNNAARQADAQKAAAMAAEADFYLTKWGV